jgi:hypothetical protein
VVENRLTVDLIANEEPIMKTARLMTTSLVAFAMGALSSACSSENAQGAGGVGGGAAGSSGPLAGAGGGAANAGAGGGAANAGAGGGAANAGAGGGAASTGAGGGAANAGAGGGAASTGAGGGTVYLDAGDESCGATKAEADVKDVNVLLVIDKSGSMADTPAGFATDKWTATRTALRAALDPVKGAISFGLELFPFDTAGRIPIVGCGGACCSMPAGAAAINIAVEPGTTAFQKILGAVASQDPGGATPMAAALKEALAYFSTGDGAKLAGGKYVVLATDGAPNCNEGLACDATKCTVNIDAAGKVGAPPCVAAATSCCVAAYSGSPLQCLDDSATGTQIAALKAAGVTTFVIGIPGSESYASVLDAFAVAGGQAAATSPKYFAVSAAGGAASLTDAFKAITTKLVTACDLKLKSVPPDPTMLNVRIDNVPVPKATAEGGVEAGADGWALDQSTSPPTLKLLGATCDKLKQNGANNIQVLFGCPYIPIY